MIKQLSSQHFSSGCKYYFKLELRRTAVFGFKALVLFFWCESGVRVLETQPPLNPNMEMNNPRTSLEIAVL